MIADSEEDWASLLSRAGLAELLRSKAAPKQAEEGGTPVIRILVDLAADAGQARRVEALIDALLACGPARIEIAASADSSTKVAANRDVYALSDIAGYRYHSEGGNEYDIIDLADDQRADIFPAGSVLHGTPGSGAWIDADIRIVYATARFDGLDGFGGALNTLICALPKADKDLHYRLRRDAGEVVAALLDATPPDLTLLEWIDPQRSVDSVIRVVGSSPLLVDMAAALKFGLDPFALPVLAQVARVRPPPVDFILDGDLTALAMHSVPSAIERKGRASQGASEALARLAQGWTRRLDPTAFPVLRTLDAQALRVLAPSDATVGRGLQPTIAAALGAAAHGLEAWQTLFAKDTLVQRTVTLDIDPGAVPETEYARMLDELESLAPIARAAPERADGLRWRKWDRAVLFAFERTLPIPFDHFVAAVDVSRAISFMNDYLGGVIVAASFDDQGRPIRQAERNLYLPQPNYLALYGGKPIDVSKIEVVSYAADEHRLTWKTLNSSNGSAEADDGFVSFARSDFGTQVTIVGKQLFTLPPVWQMFDLSLWPAVEEPLTTMAYHTFFDRTLNNFEALVEGRDVRLGRDPDVDSAHPSVAIEETLARLAQRASPFVEKLKPKTARPAPADADGFVHVVPGA
ncbi:hypothetical protein HNO88_003964 [Novosphingobium chloroacetimidivorans]|uniref:DUF362 domain-containing protein n=1 Tax=Novosphingobium chloroacetimidivorans TaxID=1428314 RepID=A0A7W7KD28_9SPHN|nr:DUF362 domain-containing protein [Novosphingobium chloroacetimidivorans]MBB4860620.1 hypothetical protein [Novosphingobium chloroacetimidivorans]